MTSSLFFSVATVVVSVCVAVAVYATWALRKCSRLTAQSNEMAERAAAAQAEAERHSATAQAERARVVTHLDRRRFGTDG